jgi:ubiquitin carboxyl-terminal hydrolase 16/45
MLFGGKLTSILVCQKCKHISQTYEDFNDISLSIKPEDYFFGHSNGGRKRDKLKMLAKKLTIFPSSGGGGSQATQTPNLNTNPTTTTTELDYQATLMSMEIQRPSSVPPSPSRPRAGDGNAHSDGEEDGHPSFVEFPRRKSLDLAKTGLVGAMSRVNVDVETASSSGAEADVEINRGMGNNDNAEEDEIIMESDSSHVLVHVASPEERHIEPTGKEDKEKKEIAGWARLGRRISVTVGLGRSKGKEKMRSKERDRKRWSSGLVKEKADVANSTDGSMQKSVNDSGVIEWTSGLDTGLEKPRISSRGILRRSQTAAAVGMSSEEATSTSLTSNGVAAVPRPMAISSSSSSGSVSTAAFKLFKPLPRASSSLNTSTLNASVTPTVASQFRSSQNHNQYLEAPSGAHHSPNTSSTRLPLLSNVQRSRSPKPPKPTAAESEYLGKVLADVVSSSSGLHSSFSLFKPPTLMLSGTHPFSTSGSSSGGGGAGMWLGLHQFSGIEECLRLFTAVEVLDGENMVGCRRCWKIVNGMLDAGSTKQEEEDSDQEQEQEERYDDTGRHERQARENSLIYQDNQDQVVMANEGELKRQRPTLEALSTANINGPIHIPTSMSTPTVSFYTLPNSSDSRSISSLPTEATSVSDINEDPSLVGFSLKGSGDTPPGGMPIPTISTTSPLESPLTARTSFARTQYLAASAKESMVEPFVMDMAGDNNRSINGVLSGRDHSTTYPLSSVTSPLLTQQALSGYNDSSSKDSLMIPKMPRHQRRRTYDSSTSPSASATDNESSDDEESDTSVGTSVSGESSTSASVTNNRAASLLRLQGQQQAPEAAQSQQMKPKAKKPKPVIMRPAYKRYLISLPPPVLVIHLKRFQQTSKMPLISFSHGLKKLDDYVSFPEYLDLKPFLAPKKEDYGLGKKKKKGVAKGKVEKCIYRLYAVVVHIGNMVSSLFTLFWGSDVWLIYYNLFSSVVIILHIRLCHLYLALTLLLQRKRMLRTSSRSLQKNNLNLLLPNRRATRDNGHLSATQLYG